MANGKNTNRTVLLSAASALATVLCIIVPRIGPLIVASGSLAFVIFRLMVGVREVGGVSRLRALLLRPEMFFCAWILIACLWAYNPLGSFLEAFFLAILIIHAIFLSTAMDVISELDVKALALGVLTGVLLAGVFVCYEIWARDAVVRYVLAHFPGLERGLEKHAHVANGKIVSFTGNLSTRSSAVLVLFLCPALLAAWRYTRGGFRILVLALITAFCIVIVASLNTKSQTAQMAVLAITVTLPLALAIPRGTLWLVGIGFAANLFLIVPVALTLYIADMHENQDLFWSARARVIIWNYTAERVLERPILGVGTNSTRYLDEERVRRGEVVREKGLSAAPQTRAHPHNIYLQIWYELGIVGALAFAMFGFSLLVRIASLLPPVYPVALAHFAAMMTVIMPSYGLWQNWFQSAIVMSTVVLILIGRSQSGTQRSFLHRHSR